jgi:hypothetical protein
MRVLTYVLTIGLSISAASAQTAIIQDGRIHTARRLAGTIYGGETSDRGRPLPHATVELCDARWRHCSAKVTADSRARFSIHARRYSKVYYLRISQENFRPMRLKVHVDSRARYDLEISLSAAI